MASQEVRDALRERFPVEDVKQRPGAGTKLDYVAGETVIERLLNATEGYAWQSSIHTVEQTDKGWAVVVQGVLLIDGDAGTGMGAMINRDLDMAVKSANTEALKNAAKNGFGVGLELWDKEYREQLGQRRRAIGGSEAAKKQLVFAAAKKRLGTTKPTVGQVADLFDVSVGDLSDPEVLQDILVGEGLA